MSDITYKIVSLADITQKINYDLPLAWDSETIGFYGKIRLAQFYQRGWDDVLMVEYPNPYELVAMLTKAKVFGHNLVYDISCIQDNIGKQAWMPEEFDDTFLLARLYYYTKEGFSLDKVVNYVLGFNPYEGHDEQLSDWSVPVLSENQLLYAAMDVLYLHDVYDKVKEYKEDYNYRLDILMTRYCLEFQCNGMPLDIAILNETYASNMEKIKKLGLTINCNSYQQVRAYIGSNESDDLGLAKQAYKGNERAKVVRETRKITKQNSFLTSYLKYAIEEVLYGHFKVSARSGRSTCSDENLQQIPRALKKIFGVPEDGDTVLVYSDFSQIQMRGVCVVTGDTAMETIFRNNQDIHNYVVDMTAAQMPFGEDKKDEARQIAKGENYTLLFGAGATVLGAYLVAKADMWLEENTLYKLIASWKKLWKQVKEWQDQGMKDWKKGIPWETPLGRKYVAKMMTDQLAMQIQGFEAEIAKLALHYMMPRIKTFNEGQTDGNVIKLRNFMHDSYMFTCPKSETAYQWLCKVIADAMQEAWKEMCQNVKIKDLPMPVKVRVGYNWADVDKNDIFIYEYKQ